MLSGPHWTYLMISPPWPCLPPLMLVSKLKTFQSVFLIHFLFHWRFMIGKPQSCKFTSSNGWCSNNFWDFYYMFYSMPIIFSSMHLFHFRVLKPCFGIWPMYIPNAWTSYRPMIFWGSKKKFNSLPNLSSHFSRRQWSHFHCCHYASCFLGELNTNMYFPWPLDFCLDVVFFCLRL